MIHRSSLNFGEPFCFLSHELKRTSPYSANRKQKPPIMVHPSARSTLSSECTTSKTHHPAPFQRNNVVQEYVLVPLTDKTRPILSRLDPLELLVTPSPLSFPHINQKCNSVPLSLDSSADESFEEPPK